MGPGHELHDHAAVLDRLDRLVTGVDAQFLADLFFDCDLPALSDSTRQVCTACRMRIFAAKYDFCRTRRQVRPLPGHQSSTGTSPLCHTTCHSIRSPADQHSQVDSGLSAGVMSAGSTELLRPAEMPTEAIASIAARSTALASLAQYLAALEQIVPSRAV